MRYEKLEPISREDAEDDIASGDVFRMCQAVMRLSMFEPDRGYVEQLIFPLLDHDVWQMRAAASTAVGHIARFHGSLDLDRVLPKLQALCEDPQVEGYALDALDDIDMCVMGGTGPNLGRE